MHHETSREGSNSDEHHSLKTDDILRQVLAVLDKNGDGVVTKREFLSAGPGALPNFEGVEGLGHHYNSEGEVRAAHGARFGVSRGLMLATCMNAAG